MPHYLTRAYGQSTAYLQGVRADPRETTRIIDALDELCDGLSHLAEDSEFWDALVEHLEATPDDVNAHLEEVQRDLDAFLDRELEALKTDMEGDEEAARRLLDDLGVTVAGAGFDEHAISGVRDATEQLQQWVCDERDTLIQATQQGKASWRGRFRALRIAISGTFFMAGAAAVGVNIIAVVPVEPGTGVASMKFGISAMMAAYHGLRADLETRPPE